MKRFNLVNNIFGMALQVLDGMKNQSLGALSKANSLQDLIKV